MIEIIINGQRVDVYDNTSVSLNFNSSVWSDVGSIVCNGSQSIRLPRTINNDIIFELATRPDKDSSATHAVLPCECYCNGVALFNRGTCHLLDTDGDSYSIAITWGSMARYSEFLSNKPSLRDLTVYDEDYVSWNQNSGVSVLGGGISRIVNPIGNKTHSILYRNYNYGVPSSTSKSLCNISPCVTLLEIWDRIVSENSLDISITDDIRADMDGKVIVLTKLEEKTLNTENKALAVNGVPLKVSSDYQYGGPNKKSVIFGMNVSSEQYNYGTFYPTGDGTTSVKFTTLNMEPTMDTFWSSATAPNPKDYQLNINIDGKSTIEVTPTIDNHVFTYNIDRTIEFKSKLTIYITLTRWKNATDTEWNNIDFPIYSEKILLWGTIVYISQKDTGGYPLNKFSLVPNLPNISQIDFIKFICQLYGLAPVQQGEAIKLLPFDILNININNGNSVDWSDKMINTDNDAPQRISYTFNDFARNNSVGYKKDSNENHEDIAYIVVDDKTLDVEKKFIEFPFAASRTDNGLGVIPQYYFDDNGDLQKRSCEYRLMCISSNNRLDFFKNIKSSSIIQQRYYMLQEILQKPKVIEEQFILNELDLKSLDYTKPVYLSKYGRYYAIIHIRWSANKKESTAELLQL